MNANYSTNQVGTFTENRVGVYSKRFTLFIVLRDSQEATDNKLILHKNPVFYTEKITIFYRTIKKAR